MNGGTTAPSRISEVTEQMQRVAKKVDVLRDTTMNLQERLSGILRQKEPTLNADPRAEQPRVKLAEELSNIYSSLQDSTEVLQSILERVEL